MIVWDRGDYETADEAAPEKQLRRGEMKVILRGEKLRGQFVLVHMGRGAAKPREKSRWLLIKKRDEFAKHSWRSEDAKLSRSVMSGQTLEEIAERPALKRAA